MALGCPPYVADRRAHASALRIAVLGAGLLGGCAATEGPLVVRQHGGAAGSGSPAAAGGVAGAASTVAGGSAGIGGVAGTHPGGSPARPAPDITWQVQLSGTFDASVDVAFYYLDLDNLTHSEVLTLTSSGRHVACYLSAGTHEPWRSDAASFPANVLGNALDDYPDEHWLDIRSSVVAGLMSARLDRMQGAGCGSVAIANVTTGGRDSGLDVTAADQSNYLLWLSNEIHARGLLAGLATAEDRIAAMEPYFDWAYAQGCWVSEQCRAYAPFVQAMKAVLAVEIGDGGNAPTLCQGILGSSVNLLVKPQDLGAERFPCAALVASN